MKRTVLVAPDGGYGWVIVFASALNNFIAVPLLQNFGIVFVGIFSDRGLTAAQGSLIIGLNAGFGMLCGLTNGFLLNRFGYRKISFLGAFFMTFGVFLLSFAKNLAGFILSYGLIASLGLGLTMSSYSLALNTYFATKRNKAFSITMTITGLGPIIMPQIFNMLMEHYTVHGVILILSSICAHSFIAASLLQPVKKHMKKKFVKTASDLPTIEEENESIDENDKDAVQLPRTPLRFPLIRRFSQTDRPSTRKCVRSMSYDQEAAGIYGIDSMLVGASMFSLESGILPSSGQQNARTKYQWWRSASSVHLDSSINLFDEKMSRIEKANADIFQTKDRVFNELSINKEEISRWKQISQRLVSSLDLNLLKDPVYCNIMVGISLVIFGEVDFSITLAFILDDVGMTTESIAEFLSVMAITDITFRFFAPYIGDSLKQPPRILYLLTLLILIFTRTMLICMSDAQHLLGVALALGCIKGLRTVYTSLILPSYLPLDRLASAFGIQMMLNGLLIIVGGPFLGIIRDATGNYKVCILVINCITFLPVITWTTEIILKRMKNKSANTVVEGVTEEIMEGTGQSAVP